MGKVSGIKVLMMGARRAGKTSVLAGLVEAFLSSDINQYLHVSDNRGAGNSDKLKEKAKELREILKTKNGKTILVDESSTNVFNDYVLNVTLPGNNGETDIVFTDANGEFFANGYVVAESIKKKIKEYDAIVIAIDTPFLMEARPTINRAYNQIDNAHTLLCQLDDADGNDSKLVLFVPIKCEYWAKKGKLDQVTERVEQCYESSITALTSFKMIEVAIVPVQTVGNIVFDSHREAKILNTATRKDVKCCELENGQILTSEGDLYNIRPSDSVQDDWSAVIEGFKIRRPNSWFNVLSDIYEPKNCDQLAYFILHYMLCKTLNAEKRDNNSSNKKKWLKRAGLVIIALMGPLWATGVMAYVLLRKRMGTINLEAMQTSIEQIRIKGLWRIDTDGIKILNKVFLS